MIEPIELIEVHQLDWLSCLKWLSCSQSPQSSFEVCWCCRHMYRLHSALKWSRSSCRPVNGVGVVIFGSLVMAGGGGGSMGGDIVQVLSWFCSAWIWSVSWVTWSSSDNMVMGSGSEECRRVWSLLLLPEHMLMAGLQWISTSWLREASLLVLGEELSLKHK